MREEKMKQILEQTHEFVKEKHKGQTYAYDKDYFEAHILAVVSKVQELMPKWHYSKADIFWCTIVAYLHDIVEDTDVTLQEIRERYNSEVEEAVRLLTKNPEFSREIQITMIKQNFMAKMVKRATALVNLQTSMMTQSPGRVQRYLDTIEILSA